MSSWPTGSTTNVVPPPSPIYPVASQWANSAANTPTVIGAITAIRVSGQGQLSINVPAGTTSLTAWLANNLTGSTFETGTGVYVDGVYNTSWNPAAGSVQQLAPFTLSLDGAAHTVTIWGGYLQGGTQGTYVYAVQGQGISINAVPALPALAVAFYGDSITMGGASTPSAQKSWFALLRGLNPSGMSMEAFGGRQLWDDSGTGSGQAGFATHALLAARLVGLIAGAASRAIWLAIGINDIGAGHWDAATFGTQYSDLLDAIHSADAGAHIYAQTMLTAEGAWTTAINTAATGRAYCTAVDGTTLLTAGGFIGDGVHPNNNGSQAIALGTGAAAGTSSIRAILGM